MPANSERVLELAREFNRQQPKATTTLVFDEYNKINSQCVSDFVSTLYDDRLIVAAKDDLASLVDTLRGSGSIVQPDAAATIDARSWREAMWPFIERSVIKMGRLTTRLFLKNKLDDIEDTRNLDVYHRTATEALSFAAMTGYAKDHENFGSVILYRSSAELAAELAQWPSVAQDAWRYIYNLVSKDEDFRASVIKMHAETGLPISTCRSKLQEKKNR